MFNGKIYPIGMINPEHDDQYVYMLCTLAKINYRDENEPMNVAKRLASDWRPKGMDPKTGEFIDGMTKSLILRCRDDTGTITAKIHRSKYGLLGPPITRRGRLNKALYCVKGWQRGHKSMSDGFRYIWIDNVRYIGDLDELNVGKIAA